MWGFVGCRCGIWFVVVQTDMVVWYSVHGWDVVQTLGWMQTKLPEVTDWIVAMMAVRAAGKSR